MDPIRPDVVDPDEEKNNDNDFFGGKRPKTPWNFQPKIPKPDFGWSLFWCVLGSSLTGFISFLAVPFMVYGAKMLDSIKKPQVAVGACVLPALLYFIAGMGSGLHALVLVVLSLAIAKVAAKKQNATTLLLLALGAAILFSGVAFAEAYLSGTTISESLSEVIKNTMQELEGSLDSTSIAQFANLSEIISKLWPGFFYVEGFVLALFGLIGANFAQLRLGNAQSRVLTLYDTPTWAVILLIVGILASAIGMLDFAYSEYVMITGLNLLVALRMTFMIQGVAVLEWYLSTRLIGCGCFGRIFIIFLAFWLEMTFMVLTIFGLVDVWANFRKLEREERFGRKDK